MTELEAAISDDDISPILKDHIDDFNTLIGGAKAVCCLFCHPRRKRLLSFLKSLGCIVLWIAFWCDAALLLRDLIRWHAAYKSDDRTGDIILAFSQALYLWLHTIFYSLGLFGSSWRVEQFLHAVAICFPDFVCNRIPKCRRKHIIAQLIIMPIAWIVFMCGMLMGWPVLLGETPNYNLTLHIYTDSPPLERAINIGHIFFANVGLVQINTMFVLFYGVLRILKHEFKDVSLEIEKRNNQSGDTKMSSELTSQRLRFESLTNIVNKFDRLMSHFVAVAFVVGLVIVCLVSYALANKGPQSQPFLTSVIMAIIVGVYLAGYTYQAMDLNTQVIPHTSYLSSSK